MSNGRSLIRSTLRCFLCGQSGGLKLTCNHFGCAGAKVCDQRVFHATCARMAGLEVSTVESPGKTDFIGKLLVQQLAAYYAFILTFCFLLLKSIVIGMVAIVTTFEQG